MGVIWSLLKIPTPVIVHKTVSLLAVLATPMGLMAMGAAFKFQGFSQNIKPIIVCSVMKLVVFVVLFMPFAIYLGFTEVIGRSIDYVGFSYNCKLLYHGTKHES